MQDLKQAGFTDLIDMLSAQTAIYMTMLKDGATKEQFNQCRDHIQQIQLEVEQRRAVNGTVNTDVTTPGINFTQDSTQ